MEIRCKLFIYIYKQVHTSFSRVCEKLSIRVSSVVEFPKLRALNYSMLIQVTSINVTIPSLLNKIHGVCEKRKAHIVMKTWNMEIYQFVVLTQRLF